MKILSLTTAAALALGAAACTEPTATLPIYDGTAAMAVTTNGNAAIQLTGEAERPTPRETRARGTAIFHLSQDGESLSFKLIVANIENVVAAHIHEGGIDEAGPVAVTLYSGGTPGGGRFSGVLASGTITAADFDAGGPLEGGSMEDLLDLIAAGNAYVNVHTNDGAAPTNTGPGDFPGGELRGQIR